LGLFDIFGNIRTISVKEARKKLEASNNGEVALLDVREPKEYAQGHIKGARLMPLSQLVQRTEELDPSRPAIVYCRVGRRSGPAASLLENSGMSSAMSLEGGIEAWNGNVLSCSLEPGVFPLDGKDPVEKLLSVAWALEDGKCEFYESVRGTLKDGEAKMVFNALINSERKHKDTLFEAYGKHAAAADEDAIKKSSGAFLKGGANLEKALGWLGAPERTALDILELCLQLEANALDLYMKIIRRIDEPAIKDVLNQVLEEEKTHLMSIGKLLQSVL
jgi:rhodanese-related sulfurtransferase/rubrerythrin